MKKQLISLLLLTGVMFINGCRKSEGLVSPTSQSADYKNTNVAVSTSSNSGKPIPVTITMTITGGAFPTFTGPITTSENIIPPAEGSMYVNSFGNVFHCLITLVTSEGTLTIRELCNKATFMGEWQIVDGTGAYANLRGNGKVMMPRGQEVLEGTIQWIE